MLIWQSDSDEKLLSGRACESGNLTAVSVLPWRLASCAKVWNRTELCFLFCTYSIVHHLAKCIVLYHTNGDECAGCDRSSIGFRKLAQNGHILYKGLKKRKTCFLFCFSIYWWCGTKVCFGLIQPAICPMILQASNLKKVDRLWLSQWSERLYFGLTLSHAAVHTEGDKHPFAHWI